MGGIIKRIRIGTGDALFLTYLRTESIRDEDKEGLGYV